MTSMTPEEEAAFKANLESVGLDEATFTQAVEILTDDDYPLDKAVVLVIGAAKSGRNVIVMAEHIVNLRQAVRR